MAIDRILRSGWNGLSDRHTRRFAPFIGHWTATVCVNQDGAAVVVLHLAGYAADLAGARANLAAHLRLNALDRGIADHAADHCSQQDRGLSHEPNLSFCRAGLQI